MVFATLRPDQRKEADAVVFLKEKLKNSDFQGSGEKLYFETLNDEPAIRLNYVSNADEVIEYFDPDLKLPTWLKVKANMSFVVRDALCLLNKINVRLDGFNMKALYDGLRGTLTDIFRRAVLAYIGDNEAGYYHFDLLYGEISDTVRREIERVADAFGLRVLEFRVEKLLIAENIVDMIRTEYLNTRCLSTRAEAEIQWANSSLEILKRKSEILEQYKLPQDTLSEMEKDKALERHLKKVNNEMMQRQQAEKPTSENKTFEKPPIKKKPVEPTVPEEIMQVGMQKIVLPALGCVAGLVVLLLKVNGFLNIVGILAAVGFGLYALVNGLKRFSQREEIRQYRELVRKYEDDKAIYESDLEDYEKCKKQLTDENKKFFENDKGIFLKD